MEKELEILTKNIKDSLKSGESSLALDRLHTYTTKVIKSYCRSHGIDTVNNKGESIPLHSLVGMLSKYYHDNNLITDFSDISLKQTISLFERFNDIRNNKSFAHANDVLSNEESIYVINSVTNMLDFLNYLEGSILPVIKINILDKYDVYKYICIHEMTTSRDIAAHFNVSFDYIKDILDELNFVDGLIKKGSILSDPDSDSCQWIKNS